MRGKTPYVMICQLKSHSQDRAPHSEGFYAMAMTGCSSGDGNPIWAEEAESFQLRATRIEKLYGRDDQVGPFARMVSPALSADVRLEDSTELLASWRGDVRAEIEFVILPIYLKIRVPYAEIHDLILTAGKYLDTARQI